MYQVKGANSNLSAPEVAFELVQTLLFWLDRRENMYIQTSAYSLQNCTGGDNFSTFWLDLGAAPSPPGDFANKKGYDTEVIALHLPIDKFN